MLFVECPECEGWGFETVLLTQWEEDEENSPRRCDRCGGEGILDVDQFGRDAAGFRGDSISTQPTKS